MSSFHMIDCYCKNMAAGELRKMFHSFKIDLTNKKMFLKYSQSRDKIRQKVKSYIPKSRRRGCSLVMKTTGTGEQQTFI